MTYNYLIWKMSNGHLEDAVLLQGEDVNALLAKQNEILGGETFVENEIWHLDEYPTAEYGAIREHDAEDGWHFHGFKTPTAFDHSVWQLLRVRAENVRSMGEMSDDEQDAMNVGYFMRNILGFRCCDQCGRWISPTRKDSESHWIRSEGKRLCNDCFERRPTGLMSPIQVQGYHSDDVGTGEMQGDNGCSYSLLKTGGETEEELGETIGFELEIDNGVGLNGYSCGSFVPTAEYGAIREHFKHTHDGSLDYGFEFVSQVNTLRYFQESNDVEILCDQCKALGADDSNSNSGLHIHVARGLLGKDVFEQAMTTAKIIRFMAEYKRDFVTLSGRRADRMGYCEIMVQGDAQRLYKQVSDLIAQGNRSVMAYLPSSHYTAVNSRGVNGKTIEFRIFKSTTDSQRIRDLVAFCVGLVKGMRSTPSRKLFSLGKAFRHIPEDALKRIRESGCFLHSHAHEHKGIDENGARL